MIKDIHGVRIKFLYNKYRRKYRAKIEVEEKKYWLFGPLEKTWKYVVTSTYMDSHVHEEPREWNILDEAVVAMEKHISSRYRYNDFEEVENG